MLTTGSLEPASRAVNAGNQVKMQLNAPVGRFDLRVRPPLPSFVDQVIFEPFSTDPPTSALRLYRGAEEAASAMRRSLPIFLDEMDRAGITNAVVMGRAAPARFGSSDNEELAAFCDGHGGRFVAFAGVNPFDPASVVGECRDRGFVGIALDTGLFALHHDDSRLFPIYERAADEGMIVALTSSQLVGPDLSYSHPDRIRSVALALPELPIVVVHACWPWVTFACALAYQCPNIYLLPDCYLCVGAPGADEYVRAANGALKDQLLHGSSYPIRPLTAAVRELHAAGLTEEATRAATWDTPSKLLGRPAELAGRPATSAAGDTQF